MHWQWPARFPLVQFPNPPLIVALLADLGARASSGAGHRWMLALFYASMSVWAYEEARHGDNWFRRALGIGFAAYILVMLSRALRS
ncbi:MAG: hypothetical protein H0X28_07680 [Solirubrobacterales bacterium]|nr:hypothetical protein [Solirubrobacterales bacterium]